MASPTRTCKTCGGEKPLDAFEPYDNGKSTGWRRSCRECRRPGQRAAARDYYKRNPERFRQRGEARRSYRAGYYAEHREEALERAREWAEANQGRRREIEQAYRDRHREEVRERVDGWRKANPGRHRAHRAAYRHNRRAACAPPDAHAREYMAVLFGDPCSYCGGPADSDDHIVPLAGGGTNEWDNFTAACRTCNRRKGVQPLLAFLEGRRG